MIKLCRFLKNYKKQVILGPTFKLIESIFELIVPMVMANIIDFGITNKNYNYIVRMGGLIVLLGFVGLVSALICQYFAAQASQGFGTDIRNALFEHINSLSFAQLDEISPSSLTTRMTNDINQLQLAVAMFIRLVVRSPILVVGSIIMSMIIDLKISIIFVVSSILIAISLFIIIRYTVPAFKRIQKKLDLISLISKENLDGTRVIRAFSRQQDEVYKFNSACNEFYNECINTGRISALLNPITYIIINVSIILIVWFGANRVYSGNMMTGQIIALVNYMTQILLSLIIIANLVIIFTRASASAYRVNQVFSISPTIIDIQEKITSQDKMYKIQFVNVSFSYSDSPNNAINDISFSVLPGETVGIIGGTGSGKSTLINLIPRFYEASCGKILIDGIDVKDYPINQLRSKFGIVPQKALLFSGTIADNIRWGYPEASQDDIIRALDVSKALDFVDKLPKKINSKVEAGGRNFSGGQRQRLTIARALVGKPEILILDDSSSALDAATDASLRESIRLYSKDMTTIIISQRVKSIKHANKIIVLESGTIVGIGTHDELIGSCDVYKEICSSQNISGKEVTP